jgi:uncharacterized protein YbjT (DUF2867 family)
MRILVTGAGGFVGSLLVPRLLSEGHDVVGLSRAPDRVRSSAPVLPGDASTGAGLAAALDGVEVAYYLIHSMERDAGVPSPFAERDRRAAEAFAAAASAAGVRRIVYLGGIQGSSHLSRHLDSRREVERILLAAIPDSVALRASIVIGARSRSFRLLVRLVERMRVLALPAWRRYRTMPIDERDVTEMLLASASAPIGSRSLDIGGPDVLSYGEMIERIADLMLVSRPALRLNLNATPLASRVASAIAGERHELIGPLMEGLEGDLLAREPGAAHELGVHLHSFDAAVERALREWEQTEPLAAR